MISCVHRSTLFFLCIFGWAHAEEPINVRPGEQSLLADKVKRAYEEEIRVRRVELIEAGLISSNGIPLAIRKDVLKEINKVSQVVNPDLPGQEAVPGLISALKEKPARAKFHHESKYTKSIGGVFYNTSSVTNNVGSAVYVGDGWFASAAHVVKNIKEIGGFCVRPAANAPGAIFSDDVFPIEVESILIDSGRDIVVFRTRASSTRKQAKFVFEAPAITPPDAIKPLSLVSVAGFPNGSGIMAEFSNCRIVRFIEPWNTESDSLRADILFLGTTYRGNSGSGLFDENTGTLIGIVRAQGNASGDFENGVNLQIAPTLENCFRAVSIQYALSLIPK